MAAASLKDIGLTLCCWAPLSRDSLKGRGPTRSDCRRLGLQLYLRIGLQECKASGQAGRCLSQACISWENQEISL